MNRGTALLLAMAALLAHALAIHHHELRFAAPYDVAHVAYRLGRNLVHHGELTWNLGSGGSLASYPSPLLVGIAAFAERIYFPVTTFCQVVGMVASLLMMALSASFATNRFSGIIPPLLFVVSGGAAAAAGSGTEYSLLALFVTLAFVSFEHRWHMRFSAGMALLAVTRPETLVLVAGFLLLGILERIVPRRDGQRAMPLWTYVPAAVVFTGLFLLRVPGGSLYGVLLAPLLAFDPLRWHRGGLYLWDFVVSAAIPLLLAYPLLFLLLGRLSGAGARALGLTLLWSGVVLLMGGDTLPFSMAMTPALPLAFIAIQQGVIAAVDTHQRFLERATWTVLAAAVSLSALASKFPGSLGPFPAYNLHRAWMTASTPPGYGQRSEMGRLALGEEIRLTATMRRLGSLLRRHLDPGATLLTPWPGAVGYTSRLQVLDLFRRMTPGTVPGNGTAWASSRTTDVMAVLGDEPDYILPGLLTRDATTRGEVAAHLARELSQLDTTPSAELKQAVGQAIAGYQLIAVPGDVKARAGQPWRYFYLLRNRDLGSGPTLEIERDGSALHVDVEPKAGPDSEQGLPQLAWLRVCLIDDRGHQWWLTPTGGLTGSDRTYARIGMILVPSDRPVELFRFELPELADGVKLVEVTAVLVNPGLTSTADAFSRVSDEQRLELN